MGVGSQLASSLMMSGVAIGVCPLLWMSDMWTSFYLMDLEARLSLVTFGGSMGNSTGRGHVALHNLP